MYPVTSVWQSTLYPERIFIKVFLCSIVNFADTTCVFLAETFLYFFFWPTSFPLPIPQTFFFWVFSFHAKYSNVVSFSMSMQDGVVCMGQVGIEVGSGLSVFLSLVYVVCMSRNCLIGDVIFTCYPCASVVLWKCWSHTHLFGVTYIVGWWLFLFPPVLKVEQRFQ